MNTNVCSELLMLKLNRFNVIPNYQLADINDVYR